MTELTSIDNLGVLESLSPTRTETENDKNRTDFLELLIAQLNNQDPLDPQDGGDFLAQLAQFEMVEGITSLNDAFGDFSQGMLSSQALQATTLVGRDVLVNTSFGNLSTGKTLSGYVDVPETTSSLNLKIYDANGNLVRDLPLGGKTAGNVAFAWDGLDNNGAMAAPGSYRIQAEGRIGGEAIILPTSINVNVNSVTIDPQSGTILNLEGSAGSVRMADVLQVS